MLRAIVSEYNMINLITKEELVDKTIATSYTRAVKIKQDAILSSINTYLFFLLTKRPQVFEEFDGAIVLKKYKSKEYDIIRAACEYVVEKIFDAGYNAEYKVKKVGTFYEDRITIYWKDATDKVYDAILLLDRRNE